jgi:hypothetical protein
MPLAEFTCETNGCEAGAGMWELPDSESEWPLCDVCGETLYLVQLVVPDREWIDVEAREVSEMFGRQGLEMLAEVVAGLLAADEN